MTPTETLRFVVGVLDRHAIPYMITGSVASSLQGEPRATHDLDVVSDEPRKKIAPLRKSVAKRSASGKKTTGTAAKRSRTKARK